MTSEYDVIIKSYKRGRMWSDVSTQVLFKLEGFFKLVFGFSTICCGFLKVCQGLGKGFKGIVRDFINFVNLTRIKG